MVQHSLTRGLTTIIQDFQGVVGLLIIGFAPMRIRLGHSLSHLVHIILSRWARPKYLMIPLTASFLNLPTFYAF